MRKRYWLLPSLLLGGIAFYRWPVPERTFTELYDGDPVVAASLDAFRQIPLREQEIDGQVWRYYLAGDGPRTLLFLHGMGGAYDIWWQQLTALQGEYRVLAVTYPPVSSLHGMADAIDHLLAEEGIDRVTVIGSSLGGYLAQYLASVYPQRVEAAVFANTFPPNNILSERNRTLGTLLPWLPEWLVMRSFRKNVREVVVPAAEGSPLVAAYLLEQGYGKMSKDQFHARYRCVMDSFKSMPAGAPPALIIESDNDPLIDAELRGMLRAKYPKAQVHTLQGKGHFPYLNDAEAYTGVLREWIGKTN